MGRTFSEKMPKVKVRIPEGTYVMWMDFSGYGISPKEVHDRIYNRQMFYLRMALCLVKKDRISTDLLPSPRPMIKEAFERIAREFEDVL